MRHFILAAAITASPCSVLAVAPSFNDEIRPILSDRCFACHGFDANTREGDLRLDTPEGAFGARDGGPAIVPGKPDASIVWKRIISDDPDEVMPPSDSHLILSDHEKDLIRRWIEGGAIYEKHWSFVPVKAPKVPAGEAHPLDALIAARIARHDLTFSPEADRRTLIRRLSLDLRGLPPSPGEVDAFLADESPDAWEKLVDRFLADPSYGERMAWPWLDAARYADTNGYQGDRERTMWPWRDWIIDAFNRNLPYDEFTTWQIAGDMLPDASFEQKLATGFLRNHAINGEGGRIPEENRIDYVMDMAETVGTAWMALTMNCCRCHDHKYDPISQKEYYGLFDFFNQTPVNGGGGDPQTAPVIAAPTHEQGQREAELVAKLASLQKRLDTLTQDLAEGQPEWERARLANTHAPNWITLPISKPLHPEVNFELLPDDSALLSGSAPPRVDYTILLDPPPGQVSAIRLDAMRHPSMTNGGIGPSDSGNFVLTGFEATLIDPKGTRTPLKFAGAEATYEQSGFQIGGTLDDDPNTGWAVLGGEGIDRDHAAVFRLEKPVETAPSSRIEIRLRHQSKHPNHILGRFRLALTRETPRPPKEIDEALKTLPPQRSEKEAKLVRDAYLADSPAHAEIAASLKASRIELETLRKDIPKVMVMEDRKERREAFVLAVGSYQQPGEKVVAHTPAILPPLEVAGRPPNRLDLARWLTSREHPLTARATVNRLWQEYFGTGFVKTPEDLGVQGEIPKHQAALDRLAADFMDHGWDLKRLVRTIVTSRTYRQSSRVSPQLLEIDPENRLLARGPRFRLPAWMIRDQALAASGMLVRQVGGEPVFPWQPPGLWEEVTFGGGKKHYKPDSGEKLRRRSLYTFWRRISAPPMFFDNAKREMCEVGSNRTNSPLHALATLNDPLYAEAARALALQVLAETEHFDPAKALARAFERVLCRPPTAGEMKVLASNHGMSLKAFGDAPGTAKAFLSVGGVAPESDLPADELAALASVCLSILNTDEALNKE